MLQGEGCSLPTIAANDYPKRTSLPTCTTVYNRCTPRPVSGHPHAALSRRGRQRGRLPRARGRQDRQGGARSQALGGRRGAAQDYKPVMLCTFVLYLYSYTNTVKYIRLRSDLIPRTPKVYRGADDQSYQTWLLLHSTMQCPTVTVQIIVC